MSAYSHPLYQAAAAAAANPGFRFTSLIELIQGLASSFVDTPEERASVKAAALLAYDMFVAPRIPIKQVSDVLRSLVETAVDGLLIKIGS